jgi:hypothetical protein
MAEVVLSSEELTVLGGPSVIKVDTNIGPAGNRGVFVMFGPLNPNSPGATFVAVPQIFDLYILTDPSSDDYLQIFQYLSQDGIEQWFPSIKLTPNFYGTNRVITFIEGEAYLEINIFELGLVELRNEILSLENTGAFFSIQATLGNYNVVNLINPAVPANHYPSAVSVRVNDIFLDPSDEELKIPITFKGAEFAEGVWQDIDDKSVVVNLSILVINPNDVLNHFVGES